MFVKCWGKVQFYQQVPDQVRGVYRGVSAGGRHTCLLQNGGSKCFGNNNYGQFIDVDVDTDVVTDIDAFYEQK